MKHLISIKEVPSDSCEDGDIEIVMRIPKTSARQNPWAAEGEDCGKYDTVTGLVDDRLCEFGFSYTIDMDYKDKADQFTSMFVDLSMFMDKETFLKTCDDLHLSVISLSE
jgi:hypothetical protein